VPKIWSSPPVRHFVNYVERMGLHKPGEPSQVPAVDEDEDEATAVRTRSRPGDPTVATDGHRTAEQRASSDASRSSAASRVERLDPDDQAIADLKSELRKQPR
jgi:hypothetical protein